MNETTGIILLFVGIGALMIVAGVPLLRGRVPPNPWYGFRTRRTLADENVWYAVNRVSGQDMIIVGVLVCVSSLVMLLFGRGMGLDKVAFTLSAILIFCVAGFAIHGYQVLKRM